MLSPPQPPPEATNIPLLHTPTPLPVVESPADPFDKERALEESEQRIRACYLELNEKGLFINPPSTDDELHEFIEIAYRVTIPRKVVEEGHRAPFDFVSDLFFERTRNALAFANRNGGKTFAVAILMMLGASMTAFFAVSTRVQNSNRNREIARMIATSKMEEILAWPNTATLVATFSGTQFVAGPLRGPGGNPPGTVTIDNTNPEASGSKGPH